MLTEEGFTFAHCYLCVGRTDLRKGIDGLVSIVRLHYNRDLLLEKDSLFLFCGGRRDRIKGLLWTGDRYILLYIRLSAGSRFAWPNDEDEARKLTGEEFLRLMQGFTVDPLIGQKHTPPPGKTPDRIRREALKSISRHGS
jgi:transposase